jgi:hypothetical protein
MASSTGISISGSSSLSDGQKIMVASARDAFEAAAPDPDLIGSERMPQGFKTWNVLTYERLVDASALTEGVDLAQSQQLVVASANIEPSEHGIIATVSNRLIRRQGDKNIISGVGVMIANSLRRRQAKDVVALYDGFTASTPGTGTGLDIIHFRGSVAQLMTDEQNSDGSSAYGPAQPPWHASLHAEQISDIIMEITDTAPRGTTTGFTEDLLQRWWKGSDRLYGVQIFHSGVILADGSNDAKGGLFSRTALHMVMANEADATEEIDNSLRAREYGIFQEWGEVEIADPHGIEIYSDVTATVS